MGIKLNRTGVKDVGFREIGRAVDFVPLTTKGSQSLALGLGGSRV